MFYGDGNCVGARDLGGSQGWRGCRALHAVAVVFTIGGSDVVRADVLYDTTDMTDNQTYDSQVNVVIGGFGSFNLFVDEQAADDFVLTATYQITSVTADYFMHPSGGENASPEDGVLVEFFPDVGGRPDEVPFAAVFSAEFTVVHFTDTVFGFPGKNNIPRLTVDLSSEGITLEPGIWWVSITPVNVSDPDGGVYWWLRTRFLVNGNDLHARDGGIDHGNGYPGPYQVDDWTPIDEVAGSFDPGDIAMKIEGTLVGGEPCPADLDDSGDVGVKDLLILLGVWGTCPPKGECPADFDDSGDVGVKDLLILLGNWGLCP